jgi:hypothetical protein
MTMKTVIPSTSIHQYHVRQLGPTSSLSERVTQDASGAVGTLQAKK